MTGRAICQHCEAGEPEKCTRLAVSEEGAWTPCLRVGGGRVRVTEPGLVADLSSADYHADKEWLSSSALKAALPTYTEPDNAEALAFGTLFHAVVLEPDSLDDYAVLDAAKIGVLKDGSPAKNPTSTDAWKSAIAEAEQDGKTVVAQADWDKAHRMAESVHAHRTAASLLFDGRGVNEESAFWVDEAGIKHKARFDRRIPGAIVDLKSTSCKPLTSEELAKATASYLYDLSAAHYLAVAQGLALDVETFALVFVSKHPPHHVYVCDLDDAFLADGRVLREQAIDRVINGPRGFTTLTPPRWRRIDQMELSA